MGRIDGGIAALLTALEARDEATYQHEQRVLALAFELGRAAGLNRVELQHLAIAACLHDVGKMGIPDHILGKPGRLDAGELAIMRTHAEIGERIVARLAIPGNDRIAALVRNHHENIDGSGYPDGLVADRIPLAAQILRICDTFDAIVSRRSYQAQRGIEVALQLLDDEAGRAFNPELVSLLAGLSTLQDLAAPGRRPPGNVQDPIRTASEMTEGIFPWQSSGLPRST